MHALAVIPAAASATVTAPSAVAPGICRNSAAPYAPATIANKVKSSTSRLIHDRRHILTARYACAGRPRCSVDADSAIMPTTSAAVAVTAGRASMPVTCKAQIDVKAPAESCVSTVMNTSGQCGGSASTCLRATAAEPGGSAGGSVTRVDERLPSPAGTPDSAASGAAAAARHAATSTISI